VDDLAYGAWRPVLDDPTADQRRHATRAVVCSGKIYYDLRAEAEKMEDHPPIIRVEQLYSFPWTEARQVLAGYPALEELVWVQEEPRNMGAWTYVEPKLREMAAEGVEVSYVGRPERASPAEGYPAAHIAEQSRIAREALRSAGPKEVPGTVAAAGEGKA
jgi:2-oxoglutarate dehydrogenase E1 component